MSARMMAKEKDFSISFESVTAKTVEFKVANAQNVSLYIYNDLKDELFSEKILGKNSIVKSYNFNEMPAGDYYLVAESAQKIEKYKISITGNNVIVDQTPISEIEKPQYNVEGNRVKMHIPAGSGDVRISVSDLQNNEYYNDIKHAEKDLDLTFDMNPETTNSYVITVEKDGNSFGKIISLR